MLSYSKRKRTRTYVYCTLCLCKYMYVNYVFMSAITCIYIIVFTLYCDDIDTYMDLRQHSYNKINFFLCLLSCSLYNVLYFSNDSLYIYYAVLVCFYGDAKCTCCKFGWINSHENKTQVLELIWVGNVSDFYAVLIVSKVQNVESWSHNSKCDCNFQQITVT